ncbi:glycine cleavage system aminomethyltransferase GcvT [Candidatus Magnetaquicoccus inordinatus]|uniref:glycine cleavage system aminomethyltransferase GcvT n=1 Tax=Candidatus Magnetaquicoccus inordinatus TaxID=2496818 RepID=UPI00102B1E49|nr:glycine cleavage system aminomethyltransferase GcvT [Candidatus Magnetaquicoccus inordinatus]
MKRTPLYEEHLALGGKMVEFSGWEMPLHYGSQLREHDFVRQRCGVFDVSHMGVIDLIGARVEVMLRFLLSNDVARIPQPGQAQYGLMLNAHGGISDDLIAYRQSKERFFLVVNAGTRDKAVAWIRIHAPSYGVRVVDRRDMMILAVQGPKAAHQVQRCLPEELSRQAVELRPFHFVQDGDWRIARTGYTGEDGFELIVPEENGVTLWESLLRSGVAPVGLGARDTLRLEAGMHLYGHDMDGKTTPLETGLAWTVAWEPTERDFIGRDALESLWGEPSARKRVGLLLLERGVLRDQQVVYHQGQVVGTITSGGFSPTLQRGIALARLASEMAIGTICQVDMRGRMVEVQVVRPPFVRLGKAAYRES